MQKYIRIFAFLFCTSSFACTCGIELTKDGADKLKEHMEIIVEGTVIEVVDEQFDIYGLNQNVRVCVDRVIKGPKDLDEIVTNQYSAGNCAKGLSIGNSYIIGGSEIKKFERVVVDYSENIRMPLPNSNLENQKLSIENISKSFIRLWNRIARETTVILTDGCLIFRSDIEFATYF